MPLSARDLLRVTARSSGAGEWESGAWSGGGAPWLPRVWGLGTGKSQRGVWTERLGGIPQEEGHAWGPEKEQRELE